MPLPLGTCSKTQKWNNRLARPSTTSQSQPYYLLVLSPPLGKSLGGWMVITQYLCPLAVRGFLPVPPLFIFTQRVGEQGLALQIPRPCFSQRAPVELPAWERAPEFWENQNWRKDPTSSACLSPTCKWIWLCWMNIHCADFPECQVSLHLSYFQLFFSGQSQAEKWLHLILWGLCKVILRNRFIWVEWMCRRRVCFIKRELFSDCCLSVKFLLKL